MEEQNQLYQAPSSTMIVIETERGMMVPTSPGGESGGGDNFGGEDD